MGVVADLADRVAVMYEGEIVETGRRARRCSPRRSTTTRRSCSPPCRASSIADRAAPRRRGAPRRRQPRRRRATDLVIEYPGRFGRPGFRAVDGVELRRSRPARCSGSSARAARARPRSAARSPASPRSPAARCGCSAPRCSACKEREFRPQRKRHRLRLPGPGDELQPAAHDRRSASPSRSSCTAAPSDAARRPRRGRRAARGRAAAQGVRRPLPARALAAASASARASRARSRSTRSCSSPTSRPARSTSRCRRACSSCSRELQREFGFATLFISHDLAVVDLLARPHRGAATSGELVEEGTGVEVLGAPAATRTRSGCSPRCRCPTRWSRPNGASSSAGCGRPTDGAARRTAYPIVLSDLSLEYPPHGAEPGTRRPARADAHDRSPARCSACSAAPAAARARSRRCSRATRSSRAAARCARSSPAARPTCSAKGCAACRRRKLAEYRFHVGYLPQDAASTLPADRTRRRDRRRADPRTRPALQPPRAARRGSRR